MMKLLKKTAALLFCLTLALSVMAVTAWADDNEDTAELLAPGDVVMNPEFSVALVKSSSGNENIIDRNSDNKFEIDADQTVTFDIKLFYNHTAGSAYPDFTPKTPDGENTAVAETINGFQFNYDPSDDINHGATISAASIKIGNTEKPITHPTGDTDNPFNVTEDYQKTYVYSALGTGSNDITVPDSSGAVIGSITFAFTGADQGNAEIQPTIKAIMVQVRDVEATQKFAKTPTSGSSSSGDTGNGGGSDPSSSDPSSEPGSGSSAVTLEEATGTTDITILVNPQYTVTLNHFVPNSATGLAELQTKTVENDTVNDTTTVTYYYSGAKDASTSGVTGSYNQLTNEDWIPGYTFRGWMVTTSTSGSNKWAQYTSTDGSWTADKYYEASATTENTFSTTLTSLVNTGTITDSTNSNVKFIPVTEGDSHVTVIPPKQMGDITVTPVYTANLYTATFRSGDDDAVFSSPAATLFDDNKTRTQTYTIEDLWKTETENGTTKTVAKDFLDFANMVEAQNKTLARTAYTFVGWKAGTTAVETSNDPLTGKARNDSAYVWTNPDYPTVRQVTRAKTPTDEGVINNPQMKRYGDVEFTAIWEEDIYYAEIEYQYAGTANVLILVGVPSGASGVTGANFDKNYTYKFDDNAMFIIPEGNQRTAYVDEAKAAKKEVNGTDLRNPEFATAAASWTNYVLFAYIAPTAAGDANVRKVTIDEVKEEPTTHPNTTISYNGNVDGVGIITVGDFGNVDSLLNNAGLTTVFDVSNRTGVKARLEADMDATGTDTGALKFGSIKDVKAIYNAMGYQA